MSSNQDPAMTEDIQQKNKVVVEPPPPAGAESTRQTDDVAYKSDPNPQYIYIEGERVETKTFLRDYQTLKEKAAGTEKLPKAVRAQTAIVYSTLAGQASYVYYGYFSTIVASTYENHHVQTIDNIINIMKKNESLKLHLDGHIIPFML